MGKVDHDWMASAAAAYLNILRPRDVSDAQSLRSMLGRGDDGDLTDIMVEALRRHADELEAAQR